MAEDSVIIIGSGPVGLFLAGLLARRGLSVHVYERHADMRKVSLLSVRPSLSLAISKRGLDELARLDLDRTVTALSAPAYGRLVHAPDGSCTFERYAHDDSALRFILRSELTEALIAHVAAIPGVELQFGVRCTGIDPTRPSVLLQRGDARPVTAAANLVVAADGAYSTVRRHLLSTERFSYSQQYLDHGYMEITIDPRQDTHSALDTGALHVWRRGKALLLGFPNRDGTMTMSLFLPLRGEPAFELLRTAGDVQDLFTREFPEIAPLSDATIEDYFQHRPNPMVTIRCAPWVFESRVALIGDAAHAIVPFFGQGVTVGFEDCTCLAACIDEHRTDWPAALADYEARRRPNADAIADLSIGHDQVLRGENQTTDILDERIADHLDRALGERLPPLYTMVAFTSIPYTEVVERHRLRRAIAVAVRALVTDQAGDADLSAATTRVLAEHGLA